MTDQKIVVPETKIEVPAYLKLTSAVAARFRQTFPQYWQDRLVEEVRRRNPTQGQVVVGRVLAVLRHPQLELEQAIPGLNIVTNDGDVYYAEMSGGETPTDDFDAAGAGLRLGSASTTPTKTNTDVGTFLAGTGLAVDASYPQTNDGDADNTGSGTDILTWRFSYTTAQGNATGIAEGAIVDDRTTPTAALTHFLFAAAFDKTSSDTLKVFVNHEFTGV